jgi:hypothetical protein
MGTIAVSVDGDPIFNWQGDEAAITQLMEAFPSAAEHVGLTPNKFGCPLSQVLHSAHRADNIARISPHRGNRNAALGTPSRART